MQFMELAPGLLASALVVGGAAAAIHALSWRSRALAGRIAAVSSEIPRDEGRLAAEDEEDHGGLLRLPPGALPERDRRELVRFARKLGVPARLAPTVFIGLRLALSIVLVALIFVSPWRFEGRAAAIPFLAAAVVGAIGWYGPLVTLRRMAKARTEAIAAGLPEALELLVVCVEAGLALDDSLERVILEISPSQPDLAEELAETAADMRIMPDRAQALGNLAERVDTPAVRSIVGALSQTLRYGTPMAKALRSAAAEMRSNALLAMEERANRLPTLMTLPMMLLIMPTIFLMVAGPAALRLIDNFLH